MPQDELSVMTPREMLEPCAVRAARTVLRGGRCSDTPSFPDPYLSLLFSRRAAEAEGQGTQAIKTRLTEHFEKMAVCGAFAAHGHF